MGGLEKVCERKLSTILRDHTLRGCLVLEMVQAGLAVGWAFGVYTVLVGMELIPVERFLAT